VKGRLGADLNRTAKEEASASFEPQGQGRSLLRPEPDRRNSEVRFATMPGEPKMRKFAFVSRLDRGRSKLASSGT